mgnify:CR=1 FL=1
MSVEKVIVVGAGVAGLTAALSFAQKGARVDILEQTAVLSEVGAGLQISANAARILDRLGVLGELSPKWTEPETVTLAAGSSLKDLASVLIGDSGKARWGAPYGVLHRATLQAALIAAVEAQPNCTLHLGVRVDAPSIEKLEEISGERADIIVGADGVWSRLRKIVPGAGTARFSGFVAWRFLVPMDQAPAFLPRNRVTAFTGADAHIVTYPLKEANAFNLVAITRGRDPGEAWSVVPTEQQRHEFVDRALKSWHPDIKALLINAPTPTWWPLFGVTPGNWTDGERVALVGDAAHAMLPFAAQGAAMAIEDAHDLACLAMRMPVKDALHAYQALRKPRVEKVKARGDFNRFAYHARGPVRIARDLVLASRPAARLAADLDWIYGYRAGDTV